MNQPKNPDHWNNLASILGATPPPIADEEDSSGEESASSPGPGDTSPLPSSPPSTKPAREKKPVPPPQAPTNWGDLAESLGLPRFEPAAMAEELDELDVLDRPSGELPSSPQESAWNSPAITQGVDETGTGERTPAIDEEQLEEEEEIIVADFSDEEESLIEAVDEELQIEPLFSDDEREDQPQRRRRRRRRYQERSELDNEIEIEGDRDGLSASEGSQRDDLLEADEEMELGDDEQSIAADSSGTGDDAPGRRRRRRRRRRSKRDSDAGQRPPDAATDNDAASSAAGRHDGADEMLDELGEDNEDELGDDLEIARSKHRKIPTWQEAIKLVIDSNMDARAKSPDGSRRGRRRR